MKTRYICKDTGIVRGLETRWIDESKNYLGVSTITNNKNMNDEDTQYQPMTESNFHYLFRQRIIKQGDEIINND